MDLSRFNRLAAANQLLAIVLALLALLTLTQQFADSGPAALTSEPAERVDHIVLQRGETLIELARQGDGSWQQIQPLSGPANAERIGQLLGILSTPTLEQFAANDENRQCFDLGQPLYRLELGSTTLKFGGTEPVNHWRYVETGGRIHLIGDGYLHHLQARPEDWLAQSPPG